MTVDARETYCRGPKKRLGSAGIMGATSFSLLNYLELN